MTGISFNQARQNFHINSGGIVRVAVIDCAQVIKYNVLQCCTLHTFSLHLLQMYKELYSCYSFWCLILFTMFPYQAEKAPAAMEPAVGGWIG